MIQFQDVRKAFGSHVVLDDLSLEIPAGQITFILGKSGEGKSVTIKHIMGLMKPDSGEVVVDGKAVHRLTGRDMDAYRREVGLLFQHAALFDSLTVEENIFFPMREHTRWQEKKMRQRMREVLDQVGLSGTEARMPAELSTGEKKRVGLARALALRPKIMLYDEPTTGMDPLVSEMIDELITRLNQEETEMTSVVISHDLKAALATADNIIMLYKGKVALAGSPKAFRSTEDPVIRQFFDGRVDGPMEFL